MRRACDSRHQQRMSYVIPLPLQRSVVATFLATVLVFVAITFAGATRANVESTSTIGDETQTVNHYSVKPPHQVELEDHRLELLMTYTVFHIGLYMSLIAALIAVFEIKENVFPLWVVKASVSCFLIAGACGGIIAVNVAEYDVSLHSVSEFYGEHLLNVFGWSPCFLKYKFLEHVEHLLFWIGTLLLVGTFLFWRMESEPVR
jgi:hypothetical protein